MKNSDKINPAYLFQTADADLLCKIACGEIDAIQLAKNELISRGLDPKGRWVGFEAAPFVWIVFENVSKIHETR